MNYRNPKILQHAQVCPCQNCGSDDGTIVAAHSDFGEHGKGKSLKAHDIFVAYLCFKCHDWLGPTCKGKDPTGIWSPDREDKREMFIRAMHKTQLIMVRDGILK